MYYVKSFFETEGFQVYYTTDNLPKEIANNRCNALFADVVENNSLFVSKLEVVLTIVRIILFKLVLKVQVEKKIIIKHIMKL